MDLFSLCSSGLSGLAWTYFPYVLQGCKGWHGPIFPIFFRAVRVGMDLFSLCSSGLSGLAWTYFPYVLQGCQGWHGPIFPMFFRVVRVGMHLFSYVLQGCQGWHGPISPSFLRAAMILSFFTLSLAWSFFPYVLQGLDGFIFHTVFGAGMVLSFPTFSGLAWSYLSLRSQG